jgi:hypothetical protein
MVALEIVTLALPEFVSTSVNDCVVPVCTEPKLKLALCALNVPVGVAVPVPANVKLKELFEALLVMASAPADEPVACGAYVTLKLALAPAAIVAGSVIPPTENPLPVAATLDTVTLEPVELLRVSVRLAVLPVCTLPKLKFPGAAENCPTAIPVPESGTLIDNGVVSWARTRKRVFAERDEPVARDTVPASESVPVAAPLCVGLNTTENGML